MAQHGTTVRDVARLEVDRVGRVEETGDPLMPFRLLDDHGVEEPAVTEFLHHMLADDASPTSLRSYAYELLSWQRFLHAVEVPWRLAGRVEARDFALWLKSSKKPARQRRPGAPAPGSVNPVTGKATSGANYAARTRRHARAVIRSFYEYHREMHGCGSGFTGAGLGVGDRLLVGAVMVCQGGVNAHVIRLWHGKSESVTVGGFRYVAWRMRLRSRSSLARPYPILLSSLILVTAPSTAPLSGFHPGLDVLAGKGL